MYDSTIGADAIVILTEAEEFKSIEWSKVSKNESTIWVFDTKGISNTNGAEEFNINVWTIGEC